MTDHFAVLGVPRRPWLDAGALKERFHRLGAEHHPDVARGSDVDFSEVNAAYRTLLDPKTRVKHLLDLEFPGAAPQGAQVPAAIMDLFASVASERRAAVAFLEKRAALQTPLEIALLAPEKLELAATMEQRLAFLTGMHEELFARLQVADGAWERDKAACAGELQEIYQTLSYAGKWLEQVRGDLARLGES